MTTYKNGIYKCPHCKNETDSMMCTSFYLTPGMNIENFKEEPTILCPHCKKVFEKKGNLVRLEDPSLARENYEKYHVPPHIREAFKLVRERNNKK